MSGTASSIFISRLRGLPILDSDGGTLGKLRDVVVEARPQGRAPHVKGLVVDLFARRRAFLPMDRVYAVSALEIIASGVINARAFSRRGGEMLVAEDLFDRHVTHGGADLTIFDVAMEPSRGRTWELTAVALRPPNRLGPFGRPGPMTIVSWNELPLLRMDAPQGSDQVLAQLADMKAADVARELHDMQPERRAEVARALDDRRLADVIEQLPEDEQVDLISVLEPERAADILEEMTPDDAADLVSDLPPDLAERLLERMEPDDAEDVRTLLRYPESTAGGLMTPEPVILPPDATVAEALALVRDEDLPVALAGMVFVCRPPLEAPTGRFVGGVHIQRLLREPPSTLVSGLVDETLEPLAPDAGLEIVSRYFATYDMVVAPVVDEERRLLGAVTVDDVLDHMLPADWRGIELDARNLRPGANRG